MTRALIASMALFLASAGCSGPVVPVGGVAKLKPFKSSDLKTWVATDEPTLRLFLKPAPEFNGLFDGLRANKKIFREVQGTRIKVLERKDIGAPAVHGEILTGPHKGQDLWILESEIEPDA